MRYSTAYMNESVLPVSTTLISDLPPPTRMGGGGPPPSGPGGGGAYAPLNVHANPYGHGSAEQGAAAWAQQGAAAAFGAPGPQNRLPARDIPPNAEGYMNDEEVKANYIPRKRMTSDYLREFEAGAGEGVARAHKRDRRQRAGAADAFEAAQAPVLLAMLFFLFHTSLLNTVMYKHLAFLAIYNAEGNLNVYGVLVKSALFGAACLAAERGGGYLLSL